jgi:hypothetical protein
MPDEREPSEDEVGEIVRSIEEGRDAIAVPEEMLVEPEAPPSPAARSLYAQIISMTISQKIKLALRGNHDARMILIRDSSKLIRRFVLLNPRISDGEVIGITRNKSADDELLRMITERREWMRNYQVRLGLATNPKTPLIVAVRQVGLLDDRDLRQIAKSKNVPQAVAAHARRLLMTTRASK